jgi:ADP-ribosylglycohydrolase
MVNDRIEHARGCLIGLAVGDALGNPTEGKSPREIKARWGRIIDFLSENQSGSDDTEYALFNAKLLLQHGLSLTSDIIAQAWLSDIYSESGNYKGAGFSEVLALKNLRAGLMPPHSGQHLHCWSDGLAMRVAPFGIAAAGAPQLAAKLAEIDGCVSHAGEGIWSGRAVAAAIATAMNGVAIEEVITSALTVVPEDCWTARAIREAAAIGRNSRDVWSALEPLYDRIACPYYFWSDVAPEAVGLAFGVLVASKGKFDEAVLGGVNLGRDTDTIAAITGAVAGALNGLTAIAENWVQRVRNAKGVCIKKLNETDILEVAAELGRQGFKQV